MTEFTKEELQDLWMYIREFMGNGYDHPSNHKGYELMRKIRSMIDNYCEPCKHRSTNFDDGIYYCNECGHCVP